MNEVNTTLQQWQLPGATLGFIGPSQPLPLVIEAQEADCDLNAWVADKKDKLNAMKNHFGALLFRGFAIDSVAEFEDFVALTSSKPLPYKERSSPRDQVSGNVYTSTSHRADQEIFLHTEQSYNLNFPQNIYFYCQLPAQTGGQTPLADTRKILNRLPADLVNRLHDNGYQYKRNFIPSMYLNWNDVFQTDSRETVEQYCQDNQIHVQWDNGMAELTTTQTRQVLAKHPQTEQLCWFNHCVFFNVKTLAEDTRETLLSLFEQEELPNQTFYGDGSYLEEDVVELLINAYEAEKVTFDWQQNDVLMVDNMLVAHGREPFEGDRKVVTAMSEPRSWSQVSVGESAEY